ncbi:[protein release factor]-glutamine N5-methyltransferase [Salinihabitans flavidus]|uniref:Release factor glutamine methyltransferase n=1 Tax=Salinihabitans flavidus TaxID=569882 RepID=A0A1H8RQA5_9RHOB|nr:peptide chain release factor N(5)-glutamine methyltransferase [Salinihabitans flavidus]SEO68477.1 [protein release factor]-glutamine N5-methyltransferase [Salinihabitans flavidus]
MILRAALSEGARALRAVGIEGAERDARILLAEVLGLSPARLSLEPDHPVSDAEMTRFHAMLARRAGYEPVSRILGRRAFWGRDFEVTPDVLDPRPETETLIEAALSAGPARRLADLGTGSGIIAVTLLAEWPEAQAVASDLSAACLEVAARNAAAHGVAGRLTLVRANWFEGIEGRFDLIVSNPPYITATEMAHLSRDVAEYDPPLALTPGGDGLAPYPVLAAGARRHLRPGGRIMVETGPRQGADVSALFVAAGLEAVGSLPDLDGRDRVVTGRQPAERR